MPADIPKYALRPHSFERHAHPVQHIAGTRRAPAHFVCCVSCAEIHCKSLMNLECRFVVVWPQRQTFVRTLLQLQNRPSARADVRRTHTASPPRACRHMPHRHASCASASARKSSSSSHLAMRGRAQRHSATAPRRADAASEEGFGLQLQPPLLRDPGPKPSA